MNEQTHKMLQKFHEEAHTQLTYLTSHMSQLSALFEQIIQQQESLKNELGAVHQESAKLNAEIKKRDAIIERKSKQIQRLKNDI
jgi:peptidoglycan hydrolase CwlO-like protein